VLAYGREVLPRIGGTVSRFLVVTASVAATAAVSGKGVFPAALVRSLAYVAAAIACLIGRKMVEALRAALRKRAVVAIMGIEPVVDVTVKAGMAVEPGTRAYEDAAYKPIRAVVAVGRAVIRRIVEISVGAHGSYADVDANLGWAVSGTRHKSNGKHWKCKELAVGHIVSFVSV
jgi:hypothetical protein